MPSIGLGWEDCASAESEFELVHRRITPNSPCRCSHRALETQQSPFLQSQVRGSSRKPGLKAFLGLQVDVLVDVKLEDLRAKIASWRPNMLYISTGTAVRSSNQLNDFRTLTDLSSHWAQGTPHPSIEPEVALHVSRKLLPRQSGMHCELSRTSFHGAQWLGYHRTQCICRAEKLLLSALCSVRRGVILICRRVPCCRHLNVARCSDPCRIP